MPEVAAMQSSAKKRFDVLGTTPPRVDAYEKVTGRARYTADMHLPDMLSLTFFRFRTIQKS